ncbi:murein peptide ligase domain protein, partial [Streptococcus pyogenes SS1447]
FGVSPEKIKAGFNKSKAVLEDKKLLLLVINHAPLSLSRILLEPVKRLK